jgi:hypothetical protein
MEGIVKKETIRACQDVKLSVHHINLFMIKVMKLGNIL